MTPPLNAFSLWDHQREAVLKLREYVKAYQKGTTDRAALVHVPTGAGKTGIIALLTRLTPSVENALILAPRLALRDRLGRDVESRFFQKLGKSPALSKIPKAVQVWDSPPKKGTIDGLEDTVVIATIQAFHRWSTRPGGAKGPKDRIDLLVIDEGHCEPAPQWRQVLRTVSKPTVLFTATPYRNDLKTFNIDYDYAVGPYPPRCARRENPPPAQRAGPADPGVPGCVCGRRARPVPEALRHDGRGRPERPPRDHQV